MIQLKYYNIQSAAQEATMSDKQAQLFQNSTLCQYYMDMYSSQNDFEIQEKQIICQQLPKEGASQFENILTNINPHAHYVDKSMFIKQIIDLKSQICILHRPSKWGKTINGSMIQTYLKKENSQLNTQKNRPIFIGGQFKGQKFKKLKICSFEGHSQFFSKHFGKYPFIKLDFSKIKSLKADQAKINIMKLIKQLYIQNTFLKNIPNYQDNINRIQELLQLPQKQAQKLINENDYTQQLSKFGKLIQIYYGIQQSYLLIDNYSDPSQYICFGHSDVDEVSNISQFISDLCYQFCSANQSRKAILLGKIDVYANWRLRNVSVQKYDIVDSHFSRYFGFIIQEIQPLLYDFSEPDKQQVLKNLQKFYSGYIVLNQKNKNTSQKYQFIYQPYFTYEYLKLCLSSRKVSPLRIFQASEDNDQLFFKFIFTKSLKDINNFVAITQLFNGSKAGPKKNRHQLILPYTSDTKNILIKSLLNEQRKCSNQSAKMFKNYITYLLICYGYITGEFYESCNLFETYVPNINIWYTFKNKILKELQKNQIVKDFSYIQLSSIDQFKQSIQRAVNAWKSKACSINEATSTALQFVRLVLAERSQHHIYVEQTTKYEDIQGRIDIGIEPTGMGQSYYIHQNKVIGNKLAETVKNVQKQAFWQIYSKGYLNWCLNKIYYKTGQQLKRIKYIITRFVGLDIAKQKIVVHCREYKQSIQQAVKISKFFKLTQIINIIKCNSSDYPTIQRLVLNITKHQNIFTLLDELKALPQEEIQDFIYNKNKDNYPLNQRNFNFFMLIQEIPLLQKLNFQKFEIGRLFQLREKQLLQYSFEQMNLTFKQATSIKKLLRDYYLLNMMRINVQSPLRKKPKLEKYIQTQ